MFQSMGIFVMIGVAKETGRVGNNLLEVNDQGDGAGKVDARHH